MLGAASLWLSALCCSAIVISSASAQVPLDDARGGPPYMGRYEVGLYPGGTIKMPAQHYAEGLARANAIQPLDANGNPDPINGQIAMTSVGMSNTASAWCNTNGDIPAKLDAEGKITCYLWSFGGRANGAGSARNPFLHIVSGAFPAQIALGWIDNSTVVRSNPPNPLLPDGVVGQYTRLAEYFFPYESPPVTEAQVQVAWIKQLNPSPNFALPEPEADAYVLRNRLAQIIRIMKSRYPNLKMVFMTNAGWRGNNTNGFHPEPIGYEAGLANKWLIQAQIEQVASDGQRVEPGAGDLDYRTEIAPWIGWGPTFWAHGLDSRESDGLNWNPTEYLADGVHLEITGVSKEGLMLHHFFSSSPLTHCWFVGDGPCE